MSQQTIDPLEVHDLPSDPREMALRLLGMTRSELKEIDSKVISGHGYVGGTRADYNKIAREVITQITPTLQNQPQPVQQPQPVVEQAPVEQPQEIHQVVVTNSHTLQEQINDKDQLEFDFYKKIKPEDLEFQLRLINSRLDSIENLLQELLNKKNKKKLLVNADSSQQ